ncbi:Transcription factor LHW [Apostasia shenzhenica]|uniref:Transcription factor LHW n=1 Tax=Apostasia shenzhenica TaxID=1088818 RepID=A0A2H9ZUR1_9ASPA|nr:Transcription factor LHW [Apostasia shenzhenica]
MGFELKEALRRLCVEIGWSYAVFWRAIGSPRPKHLVWEDGCWHSKPQLLGSDQNLDSRIDSSVELRTQGEDAVFELVRKFMVPQVHVIGHGMAGQAAFTGNHQWIFTDVASDYGSMAEHLLQDVNNQSLAGIQVRMLTAGTSYQTIAVIPVLPHGVVQLGSTTRIIENSLFIKHVRNSFMQSASALEFPFCDATQKTLDPYIPQHADNYLFRDDCSIDRSLSMIVNRCNHQLFISSASRSSSQPLSSFSDCVKHNISKANLAKLSTSKTMNIGSLSLAESCQPIIYPFDKSIFHLNNRLESAHLVAQEASSGNVTHLLNGIPLTSLTNFQELASRTKETAVAFNSTADGVARSFGIDSLHPNVESLGWSCNQEKLISSSAIQNALNVACGINSSVMLDGIHTTNRYHGNSIGSFVNGPPINKSDKATSSCNLKQYGDLSKSYGVTSDSCHWPGSGNHQEWSFPISNTSETKQGMGKVNSDRNRRCKNEKLQNSRAKTDSTFVLTNVKAPSYSLLTNSGDDLFDFLGIHSNFDGGEASSCCLAADVSACVTELNIPPKFESIEDDVSCTEIFSESNTDQLLDAVVSNIKHHSIQTSHENISSKASVKLSHSSLFCGSPCHDLSSTSEQRQGEYSSSMLIDNAEAAGSTSVRSANSLDVTEKPDFYKSQISLWVDSGQSIKNEKFLDSPGERADEMCKSSKKRARPGESPRPRPKDRQLIMDRVKELREIVPNGAKCSIDALLEKTINHMLFLHSVTKHADKLKEARKPRILGKDVATLKDNFQSGATWAFDVGSQPMTCPLIVEDLNPPREMLVEMLCEERGCFLEIADLIRGLGLTILKGVIESRKDKIWACFAVEPEFHYEEQNGIKKAGGSHLTSKANKDVTRMEIFLSLVRLLEPAIGHVPTSQIINSSSSTQHKLFNPSCVPVTGDI